MTDEMRADVIAWLKWVESTELPPEEAALDPAEMWPPDRGR